MAENAYLNKTCKIVICGFRLIMIFYDLSDDIMNSLIRFELSTYKA